MCDTWPWAVWKHTKHHFLSRALCPMCLNACVIYGPVTSSAVACRLRHGEAHNRCVLRKDVLTCRDATRTRNTLPPAGLQYNTGGLWPFTGISESPFITTLTSPQCRWDCGHTAAPLHGWWAQPIRPGCCWYCCPRCSSSHPTAKVALNWTHTNKQMCVCFFSGSAVNNLINRPGVFHCNILLPNNIRVCASLS